MKILILNQHSSNHGDEAAGKALLRAVLKNFPNSQISVMYNTMKGTLSTEFLSHFQNVKQYHSFSTEWFARKGRNKNIYLAFFLIKYLSKTPWRYFLIRTFFKALVRDLKTIYKNEVIISAPSGPNIGDVYSDWSYLWKIYSAIQLKKIVIVYSPSIGQLEKSNFFTKKAIQCLKSVNFFSVRDPISENSLSKLDIYYYSSIDTAFLDDFKLVNLPIELHYLNSLNYIVIVPNELYKYIPGYQKMDFKYLDSLYINIIKSFEYDNISIVLLPQLFGELNDFDYYQRLLSELPDSFQSRIFIISENYDSDVQLLIISKSKFVIGARYHSIVFSIKSNIPFICLSYEHKMRGMLQKLGLSLYDIDINDYIKKNISKDLIIDKIRDIYALRDTKEIKIAADKARNIACDTFTKISNIIN